MVNVRYECVRCGADTRQNSRCKRRTCMRKDFCYQHLPKEKDVVVKKSAIAGLGLFTVSSKKRGEFIADYTGQLIRDTAPRTPYAVAWSHGRVIDSNSTQDGVGRYANVGRQRRTLAPHTRAARQHPGVPLSTSGTSNFRGREVCYCGADAGVRAGVTAACALCLRTSYFGSRWRCTK